MPTMVLKAITGMIGLIRLQTVMYFNQERTNAIEIFLWGQDSNRGPLRMKNNVFANLAMLL
jgi:hypothetical protein